MDWVQHITRSHLKVEEDVVGYLPTINAPATDMSMVQEIHRSALKIMSSLQLENIAVVLDQALFAKATEIAWKQLVCKALFAKATKIAWKQPQLYGQVVLMMGNFHTICNFMSSIGKMFGEAGLRNIAVESGVIAGGSTNKVLEGKQYNRAVRLHKLTYEALMRLVWKGFQEWLESDHSEYLCKLNSTIQTINNIHGNASHESLTAAMNNDSCIEILDLFVA